MIRVVTADDDRTMRQRVAAALTKYPGGCTIVKECRDGSAAIAATLAHSPDVTILDVIMAPLGGLDAAISLEASGHKCLLLTSMGQAGVVQGRDHLIKPFSDHQLHQKLAEIVARG